MASLGDPIEVGENEQKIALIKNLIEELSPQGTVAATVLLAKRLSRFAKVQLKVREKGTDDVIAEQIDVKLSGQHKLDKYIF